MGEYQSGGRTVQFTDEATLQLVSDLYQLIDHDYRGSPSVDAIRLEEMLKHLHAGMPLQEGEWNILAELKRRYEIQLRKWQDAGRDGQQALVPAGPGRVSEALRSVPPSLRDFMQEAYKTASRTKKDRQITAPHLHDGVLHDLAHARQHAERLSDPDVKADPESRKFNAEHLMTHLASAQDHAQRLGEHLEQNASDPATWRREKKELHEMRESRAPAPPQLREATGTQCCGNCKMFDRGLCWGYGNVSVRATQTCDSWAPEPGGKSR